jgi:hypothetical protein
MAKTTYDPADLNQSPFEPAMGDIVIYRTFKIGLTTAETFPAIIVRKYENDRCDLTVFTTTGVRYVMGVAYSGDDESQNTWGWLPEKEAREPKQEKTLDSGKKLVKTA